MRAELFGRRLPSGNDLSYAIQKGLVAYIRGSAWQALHLRKPIPLFLGRNIRFIYSHNLSLGRGVSFGANSYIETCANNQCTVGDNVTIRENAWIQCRSGLNAPGEGFRIGNGVYIGPNCVIGVGGYVEIEDGCQIGAGFTLSAEEHIGSEGDYTTGKVCRHGIKIGRRSWIGNNVTVLDGVELGDSVVIGAGAVVTKSLPSRSLAVGVPAKVIKRLGEP